MCVYYFVYSRMNELSRALTIMSIFEETNNTFNDEIIWLIAWPAVIFIDNCDLVINSIFKKFIKLRENDPQFFNLL